MIIMTLKAWGSCALTLLYVTLHGFVPVLYPASTFGYLDQECKTLDSELVVKTLIIHYELLRKGSVVLLATSLGFLQVWNGLSIHHYGLGVIICSLGAGIMATVCILKTPFFVGEIKSMDVQRPSLANTVFNQWCILSIPMSWFCRATFLFCITTFSIVWEYTPASQSIVLKAFLSALPLLIVFDVFLIGIAFRSTTNLSAKSP